MVALADALGTRMRVLMYERRRALREYSVWTGREWVSICTGRRGCVRVWKIAVHYGCRSTQISDGVRDAHPLAKRHDTNLGLEQVDIELQEDISGDFLFCGKILARAEIKDCMR